MQQLIGSYWPVLLIWNSITFILMGLDKFLARQHLRRIPERTLLLSGLLFGAAGCLAGMYAFRHKTQKPQFTILLPLFLLLNIGLLYWGPRFFN